MALAVTLVALGTLGTSPAVAATGDLMQPPGTLGCIGQFGGACQAGRGLGLISAAVVSPDGKNVYTASTGNAGAIAIFDRNATTGALTQKTGMAGCLSGDGEEGACQTVEGVNGVGYLVVSPDGKNVYSSAIFSASVAVFDRDATTGALTQKGGGAGTVSAPQARGLEISPDGKNVYVAAGGSDSVWIYGRDATTGALTQPGGTAGCISEGGSGGACQTGRALAFPLSVAVSPDGKNVYVGTNQGRSVVVLDRNAATGALTQRASTAGCVSSDGTGTCQTGAGLGTVQGVIVSPDGKSVYAASYSTSAVSIFDRDTTSGALTQKTGAAGCVQNGTGGACQDGVAIANITGIVGSSDGNSVYVSAQSSSSVAALTRDPATGALAQRTGTAACISQDGSGDACQVGRGLNFANGVTVSLDGKSVYVAGRFSAAVAIFNRTLALRMLTVAKAGNGGGTVTSEPMGINCGADCSEEYDDRTSVTLSASPAADSTFSGFSGGGCTGTATTCTLTLDQARSVTAAFVKPVPGGGGTPPPGGGTSQKDTTPPTAKIVRVTCKQRRCTIQVNASDAGGTVASLSAKLTYRVRTCRKVNGRRRCSSVTKTKRLTPTKVTGGFSIKTGRLKRGTYTATAVATDAAGNASKAARRAFRVR